MLVFLNVFLKVSFKCHLEWGMKKVDDFELIKENQKRKGACKEN